MKPIIMFGNPLLLIEKICYDAWFEIISCIFCLKFNLNTFFRSLFSLLNYEISSIFYVKFAFPFSHVAKNFIEIWHKSNVFKNSMMVYAIHDTYDIYLLRVRTTLLLTDSKYEIAIARWLITLLFRQSERSSHANFSAWNFK